MGLEAMYSPLGATEEPVHSRFFLCLTGMGLCCTGLVQREDRVNVGILFNPLIWLKLKPHWFKQRDKKDGRVCWGLGGRCRVLEHNPCVPKGKI